MALVGNVDGKLEILESQKYCIYSLSKEDVNFTGFFFFFFLSDQIQLRFLQLLGKC